MISSPYHRLPCAQSTSQGISSCNFYELGSLPSIRRQITISHEKRNTKERQFGSSEAISLSNGSLKVRSCGFTENVRPCQHHIVSRLLTPSHFRSGLREKRHMVRYSSSTPPRTYFPPVPPSSKTLWPFAKLDQLSWPTFTSISGISTNKAVMICYFLS